MTKRNPWMVAVESFHRKFAIAVHNRPIFPDNQTCKLRENLLLEEASETMSAIQRRDIVEVADGLADVIYICIGTALAFGIDLDSVFDEVHRTNMEKVGGPTRADGKILKPYGWTPPKIREILERQMEEKEKEKENAK